MHSTHRLRSSSHQDAGFSLAELLVSMGILVTVSSVVFGGVMNLTQLNQTVTNRTEMFAGVRNASALLQQEVGQAGSAALPGSRTRLSAAVGAAGVATVGVTAEAPVTPAMVAGAMFIGELLIVDTGANEETVTVTGLGAGTFTATFTTAHAVGARLVPAGGFAAGVLPLANPPVTNPVTPATLNGSSGSVLKVFGDIHGNGSMVYVEYTCNTAQRVLYRKSQAWNDAVKVAPGVEEVLVNNLLPNPDGSPCFTYKTLIVAGTVYVVSVAITLTVETEAKDPITGLKQQEQKALLNVSPRNVFNTWQIASLGLTNRVQPTPTEIVVNLLPALY